MEGHVNSYRDLTVYKKARELAKEIFELSKAFPDEERYSLTSQIRRSSRSVGAQISEAWAKRLYKAHFISKLTDGDGEHQETQHWIDTAQDCGYLKEIKRDDLIGRYSEVGRMISGMIDKADFFCRGEVRENPSDYLQP